MIHLIYELVNLLEKGEHREIHPFCSLGTILGFGRVRIHQLSWWKNINSEVNCLMILEKGSKYPVMLEDESFTKAFIFDCEFGAV